MDTRCFSDKELYREVYGSLSDFRRNKIDAYLYDKDKYLSMGAGYMLERGLRKLDVPLQYGHIDYGRDGKPKIKSKERVYHFNLSHSGVYAVCAFSSTEVGVDIQQMSDTVSDKMLRVGCSQREYKYLTELDEKRRRSEFYRLWTIKESYMKYLGSGLSISPSGIDTELKLPVAVWRGGVKQSVNFKEYVLDGYKLAACSGASAFAPDFKEVKLKKGDAIKI